MYKTPAYGNPSDMKEYIYDKKIYDKQAATGHRAFFIRTVSGLFVFITMVLLWQLYMEKHFQIYENTLRFHVRAASDEPLEQEMNLRVRDAVLGVIKRNALQENDAAYINKAGHIRDASHMEAYLEKHQRIIEKTAETCLNQYGCQREVKAFFTKERFPIRQYDDIIFPAGNYHAVRIDIGAAKGHNWWCALYPELCYNKKDFALSKEGQQQIKETLSHMEQKLLTGRAARWGVKAWSSVTDAVGRFCR